MTDHSSSTRPRGASLASSLLHIGLLCALAATSVEAATTSLLRETGSRVGSQQLTDRGVTELDAAASATDGPESRRHSRRSMRLLSTPKHLTTVTGGSRISADSPGDDTRGEAGVQFAARQELFNYGMGKALDVLEAKVAKLHIPDVSKSIDIPVIGGVNIQISDIKVTHFVVSSDDSTLKINDGSYALTVHGAEANLTFGWHWEKSVIQGTGVGELFLKGGNIEYTFELVTDPTLKAPQLKVLSASSEFQQLDLIIHSGSADWVYQAVLKLFGDAIRKKVNDGIAQALEQDVPNAINGVLKTLPTHVDITGLPINVAFDVSIYTLKYVLVKGYTDIDVDGPTSPQRTGSAQLRHGATAAAAAAAATAARSAATAASTAIAAAGGAVDEEQCPFIVTSQLPLSEADIGADAHMGSLYLHESVANCILWALHRQNVLRIELIDGTVPKLHLTTDLLAMLIPDLPKQYPRQLLQLNIEALKAPEVHFTAADGANLQVQYRTTIIVANATLGNPVVASLVANVNVTALLDWDATTVTSAVAQHTVENSTMPVPVAAWDATIAWFIKSYGGLYPLHVLFDSFVKTPVSSMITLSNADASAADGWFLVSSDFLVHDLPSVVRSSQGVIVI